MRALPLCLAALALFGCTNVEPDARYVIHRPSQEAFPPVGLFLVHGCGSLDCHGTLGRNLRLYGAEGQRLAKEDQPAGSPTTQAELDEDYRSVVAIEPELLSQVVKENGKNPERLTLVRKPRALEDHAGGKIIDKGDEQDRCLKSWLAGAVDQDACSAALDFP